MLEADADTLDAALEAIETNCRARVEKGRMTAVQGEQLLARITRARSYDDLAGTDIVIEAVFETMDVKREVFGNLGGICKPGAILASNTSTLDLDRIAAATGRPEDVVGLHFFAPADVMPLLEIVRGAGTAPDVLATAAALARRIGKVGVIVGVCFGFVGNRMFFPYVREAQLMVLEGAAPERIDRTLYEWGMAMGPLAVCDLSGLDVFHRLFEEWQQRPDDPAFFRMGTVLHGMGRLGSKSGAGFYRYEGRTPVQDPMFYADTLGLERICVDIRRFREQYGDRYWTPAPLLETLADEKRTFSEWSQA
jgi:3-hydroxyacyl-CoA dehydrogenase